MPHAQPSLSTTQGLRVRIVSDPEEFVALRHAWNALVARCRNPSVFLSHEWFHAAWQWRQVSARLHVLCLCRGETLCGLLPLVSEDASRHERWTRRLEFLTVPDTQVCDLIAPDDECEPAAHAFASELAERTGAWDVLRLRYLPENSIAGGGFRDALQRHGATVTAEPSVPNPYVALDTTWDEYYSTRSRSLKKANNLAANRLKKAGEVRIEWLAPGTGAVSDVTRMVEAITAISARSWKAETGNSLENAGPQAFIHTLSESAHRNGWLSVWLLTLDGQAFAMEYQLVADGSVYALRSDFDRACEERQISPGSHLSRHLLEQLFGKALRRYFMGPGENAYKYRWTEETVPTLAMNVYARSLRGRALQAWEMNLKPMARGFRDRVRRSGAPAGGKDDAVE